MVAVWSDAESRRAERRQWERYNPDGPTSVTLATGGRAYGGELLDLSLGGARLRVDDDFPDEGGIVIQHRVGGLFFGSPTWRRGNEIGVRFRVPDQTREHALQCATVLLYGDDDPAMVPVVGLREGMRASS